jgi:hypothetical protein
MITLQGPALKLIENNLGRTFVVSQVTQMVQLPAQSFMPPQLPALPPGV